MSKPLQAEVSQAILVIASHLYSSQVDAMTDLVEINGVEYLILVSMMPASQARSWLEQNGMGEFWNGENRPNTPASQPSPDSGDTGSGYFPPHGKRGIS